MEKIKVKRNDLVSILKKNREKHVNEYKEAVRQFRLRAVVALKKELDKAQNGKKFETNLSMSRPTSHEKDYDLAIRMLEMTVEDVIVVDYHDFNNFVNDEWSWKPSFNNSAYGFSGTSGTAGSSGTSGTSGFRYVSEETGEEETVTVTFSGDELYELGTVGSVDPTYTAMTFGTSGFSGESHT